MLEPRRMRWAGYVTHIEEKRNVLMGKPEGKKPLGRFRRRYENNIKWILREICWGRMDRINLVQDRDQWRAFVDTATNLRVPYNFGKFLSS
jgi:hypothetical protein